MILNGVRRLFKYSLGDRPIRSLSIRKPRNVVEEEYE
jgi:hypothetical protein